MRDRIPREDASRIRGGPGILARPRSFALNLPRANGIANVSERPPTPTPPASTALLARGLPETQNRTALPVPLILASLPASLLGGSLDIYSLRNNHTADRMN